MKPFFLSIHVLISIILVGLILLQSGKGGLGKSLGDMVYRSKRGAERVIFIATFVFAFLFFITTVANMLLK